ncbi:hypothetical protein [Micromonospora sp. NBC_01813]|uniref:hypothetical protein n=1 Tax=Micromonospora sp. NBC_01813 TaxID=2975988 RepID=UPI002DD88C0E|nr:hypothetical protein [Micromonospora sp. NBC_01813]WSA07203.1 hypothetical protein OG958_23490 [Micromonospora sp. NBC_01813]
MTSVGDVIGQLVQILSDLDGAAVEASNAQQTAAEGLKHYKTATTGADSIHAAAMLSEASEAVAKSGKVARLIAEATTEIASYMNHIAPGSVPDRSSGTGGMPTGEILSVPQYSKQPKAIKALGRIGQVRAADDGLQHIKKAVDWFHDAANAPGGSTVSRPPDFAFEPTHQPSGTAGEALLAALTLAVLGAKGSEVASRIRERAKNRKSTQKDDTNG